MDYVGIGWLISASVGTVVHYGYQCYPKLGHAFEALCFMMGLLGNVFPFMDWFNKFEYRVRSSPLYSFVISLTPCALVS